MPREVTLVVAVEDAATAAIVSAGAAHLAMEQGATQVILLHAFDSHNFANALYGGGGVSVPAPATPIEESRGEAEEVLSLAEAAFRAEYQALECPLPTISRKLAQGRSCAGCIAQIAADAGAKAIVVGARRPHVFGRLSHPEFRTALARHTAVPVHVVPLHAPPHKSPKREHHQGEQPGVTAKRKTVILVSLELLPEEADRLLADWPQTVAAASLPACRYLRLLHDQHDERRWVVATEWDDPAAFDEFMRKSGLQWRGRARALSDQTRYAYYDVEATDATTRSDTQPPLSASDPVNTASGA